MSALIALRGLDLICEARLAFPDDCDALEMLPDFPAGKPLPFTTGAQLAAYYRENGYGFFAKASFFTVGKNNDIIAIEQADSIRLSDLKGYARQKDQVITNTLAFLESRPANNILLYGDKGTGKSSTVKAVVNEYADRGLKIVEISPNQVSCFPMLCREAARSPYRIIIFMDDLTFDREDDNFAALKAFIEGGLTGMPSNLILYATSNRRHLVRESFSERQGDDIHVRDTLETITSLSDRFGLEITFSVPDKDEYLSIIDQLAEEYGLTMPTEQLHLLAERFAIRRNGTFPTHRPPIYQLSTHAGTVKLSSFFRFILFVVYFTIKVCYTVTTAEHLLLYFSSSKLHLWKGGLSSVTTRFRQCDCLGCGHHRMHCNRSLHT